MSRIISALITLGLAFLAAVMAAMNFSRLQYRPDPPMMPDYFMYVFAPGLVGLILFAAACFFLYLQVKRPVQNEPPSSPSPLPTMPPSVADIPSHPVPDRAHIWAMIDELSEAMVEDDEGSEALHTVRDRFHRIQFAPPQKVETVPPKATKPLPRAEAA